MPLWRSVENTQLRSTAAALLLGSVLGCAYTATQALDDRSETSAPLISPTEPARQIAPLAVPPRENYGAPFVESRIHPVVVAAAILLFSLFGLSAFESAKVPNTLACASGRTEHS